MPTSNAAQASILSHGPVTATNPARLPLHSITKLNLEFYCSLKI